MLLPPQTNSVMRARYVCHSCLHQIRLHRSRLPDLRFLQQSRNLVLLTRRRASLATAPQYVLQLSSKGASRSFIDLSSTESLSRSVSSTSPRIEGTSAAKKKIASKATVSKKTASKKTPTRKTPIKNTSIRKTPQKSAASKVEVVRRVIQRRQIAPVTSVETSTEKEEGTLHDLPEDEALSGPLNIAKLDAAKLRTLRDADTIVTPLHIKTVDVPRLSFDLQRVLFNPGVYHLRDPRSRVYNFSPYLEKIMPVTDFDFSALNEYVTSSKDSALHHVAKEHGKKFIGSSSSMTGILSHFHFLLSAFRGLNFKNISKGFKLDSQTFTKLTMGPAAVFLRYRDGIYATDADKEFDEANILMSMGKSVEKLLTLEKDDFERYRKSANGETGKDVTKPEQYHYSTLGNVLMRSQLDAYDPRLPGSGMFDLKTRAVAAIRMNLQDHESGQGYEIKRRFGTWESFEREYHDMMRSAFLKYSLQVRMGRMDGIFVAYHNIERMFGFQYISLPELDLGLHGQNDTSLGDREYAFSVKILDDVFNRATEKFPKQTLRLYFETRPPTEKIEPVTYMNVFAEPIAEEEVDKIQAESDAKLEAFERRIFGGESVDTCGEDELEDDDDDDVDDGYNNGDSESVQQRPGIASAADSSLLDSFSDMDVSAGSMPTNEDSVEGHANLVAFRIVVRHEVNGQYVHRPRHLTAEDRWSVDYTIEEMAPSRLRDHKYKLCRTRRENALKTVYKDKPDPYISNLIRMSDQGRKWREALDERDSEQEQVVLYEGDGEK